MTASDLYSEVVTQLEEVLSPRVVSRSLKEGMAQTGTTPTSIGIDDVEKILKGPVYRHLQVIMPLEQAKDTVAAILEQLKGKATRELERSLTPPPLDSQFEALSEIQQAMRPFNLYFEWPEVQKLRTQVRLLENEQAAGKEASELLNEAREQLRTVIQKLEDQLVIQARDVGDLESVLDGLEDRSGVKVRRLENLLGQVREAQANRQLAPAEIQRARKLATDLRKETAGTGSSASEAVSAPAGERAAARPPEDVKERLLKIDLDAERFELAAIEKSHAQLAAYRPDLKARVEELREQLANGNRLGEELGRLRRELEKATDQLRQALREELEQITRDSRELGVDPQGEFGRALEVAHGVLENSLPESADMARIRDLYTMAAADSQVPLEAGGGGADAESLERIEELGELRTLEIESARFAGAGIEGYDELRDLLDEAQIEPQGQRLHQLLSRAWLQLEALRSTIEQRLSGVDERLDNARVDLERVEKLNSEGVEEARRILRHLDSQRASLGKLSLGLRLELEGSLQHAESLLAELDREFEATQAVAGKLVSGNFIDDMLGLLGGESSGGDDDPESFFPVEEPDKQPEETARSGDQQLDEWLDRLQSEEGVHSVAAFDHQGTFLSGKLPAPAAETGALLASLLPELNRLGEELTVGESRLATIEVGGRSLVVGRGGTGHAFLALLDTATGLTRMLHRLRNERPLAAGNGGTKHAS